MPHTRRHSARHTLLAILLSLLAATTFAQRSVRPNATTPTGTVTSNPATPVFESTFTLTATFTPPAGASAPTGSVAFTLDASSLAFSPVAANFATTTVPAYIKGSPIPPIFPGTHTLTAQYSGDATYAPITLTAELTILRGPTSVTLTPTTPIPTPYGDPVDGTFEVNVLDPFYPPTGTYTVLDNGVAVPECTALPLTSVCPYGDPQILDAGPHALSVAYNGDPINAPSASAPLTFTVTQDAVTSATLTSSPNPATLGSPVTFAATLTGSAATPSGTVQFLDGGIVIGTGTLNASGVATFTTSTLSLGAHPITVVYAATADFAAATSNTVPQQIAPPVLPGSGFTLTVTPTPVTVLVGSIATLQITVTSLGSFTQPVQLSCSGLPDEATCTFAQSLIPASGGATTLLLATASPHDCNTTGSPYFPVTTSLILLTGLTLLRRDRRLPTLARILLLVAALATLTQLTACGHCTDLGTNPGNYTITVTGVAQQGTALTQSQRLTLKVTL